MHKAPFLLTFVFSMMLGYASDVPAPPECVRGVVESYNKQYDKVYAKRKDEFMHSIRKRCAEMQDRGDYSSAKKLQDYAEAVATGEKLRDGSGVGCELPDFFKKNQWNDTQGGIYSFYAGQMEDSKGKSLSVTYAGRDYIIVNNEECWFYENAKQIGRFSLKDGSKCSHFQAGAPCGKKVADVVTEMEGKFWTGMRKAMTKSRSKLKNTLTERMKKMGATGKLDDAAAVQQYLEELDEESSLRSWCKMPTGTFVAPASGWVVEFERNSSVHYGPGRSGLHHQPFERCSPNREVYFYKGSTMLYIKGKLHKIANDTHRVLVRQRTK